MASEPGAVFTIPISERLHAHVRPYLATYRGADTYYHPDGHTCLILAGDVVLSIRDDGIVSTASVGEWFAQGVSRL